MARSSGYILPPDDVRGHHFKDPAFKKFMVVSVAVHILIIVLAGTMTLFRLPGTTYSPIYTVDLVTLPPSSAARQPKAKTTVKEDMPPAVEKKASVDEPGPEKTDSKIDFTLTKKVAGDEDPARTSRKKRLEELEKEAEKLFKSYSLDRSQQPVPSSRTTSGLADPSAVAAVSPVSGPSIVGVGSRPADIRFRAYYDKIIARVTAVWVLPEGIAAADRKLLTVIGLRISASGIIEKQWIVRRSGNIYYDQSAIRAINKASPLPPLPEDMKEKTHDVGIKF